MLVPLGGVNRVVAQSGFKAEAIGMGFPKWWGGSAPGWESSCAQLRRLHVNTWHRAGID